MPTESAVPIATLLITNPFFFFFVGLIFGSFGNVCAWRIPLGQSIVAPRSHCPACKTLIPWWCNIPLLSYVFLRGRCAACRMKISIRYPLVELLCGILFALQPMFFSDPVVILQGVVLSFTLLVVSDIDLRHQIIPDVFSVGLLVVGVLSSPWGHPGGGPVSSLITSLIGAGAGFLFMFSLSFFGALVFKKEALGGGDVKLMAAAGAFLGWQSLFVALFIGSLIGTVVVAWGFLRGRLKRGDYLPFGPFLAAGILISWLAGQPLFVWLSGGAGLHFG
jgi:leader peptidase (prepilin peptidase)/N-methyltransferase